MKSLATQIALRGIRAYGRHGADDGEREHPQPIDVDVEVDLAGFEARQSDALADTIDYAWLYGRVRAIVADSSFRLLERLGQSIIDDVMQDRRVGRVRVTIAKPCKLSGATPAVTLTESRD